MFRRPKINKNPTVKVISEKIDIPRQPSLPIRRLSVVTGADS